MYYLVDLSVPPHNQTQLALSRPVLEDTPPHTVGVQLIGRKIPIHKPNHLLGRHPSRGIPPRPPQRLLLLLPPRIHVLHILGINMDQRVQRIRHGVIVSQFVVDEEKMLQPVLTQRPAGGGGGSGSRRRRALPSRLDVLVAQGTESDGPALKDDDLDGLVSGLVDGSPGLWWETIALAGEEGFVVAGDSGGLGGQEGFEDGFEEFGVVGSCGGVGVIFFLSNSFKFSVLFVFLCSFGAWFVRGGKAESSLGLGCRRVHSFHLRFREHAWTRGFILIESN